MPTITGPITPNSNTFAAVDSSYVAGGLMSVTTTTSRDEIPASRRKRGMLVYCADVDLYYRLNSDLTTWTETDVANPNFGGRVLSVSARHRNASLRSVYLTPATGTPAWGSADSTSYIFLGNRTMIGRDMPYADAVSFYFGTGAANVTNLTFQIWRRNPSTFVYRMVGTTENLSASLTESAVNTIELAKPIVRPRKGDHVGMSFTVSTGTFPFVPTLGTVHLKTAYKATATLSDDMWDSGLTLDNSNAIAIDFLGPPPDAVAIGDSLTAGSPGTRSTAEAAQDAYEDVFTAGEQYTYALEQSLGITTQNQGISSQKSADIVARFSADVLALKPRVALICMGTNSLGDYGAGGDYSALLDDWVTVIDACIAANVWPVCIAIPPRTDWCSAPTYWASQMRRAVNEDLAELIADSYSGRALYVNLDSTIGEFYALGDVGNLDKLQAAYNADSVHLTTAGYTAMGNKVAADMKAVMY